MYSLLLALIYIAFISLGVPDSLLGSGWPAIHNDLNVPVSFMGIVSMVISGGTIVSSLLSDKLTRKLGTRIVTVSSVFLTAFALLGFSFSNRFWMLIVFAIPYGLGAGAIDAALNNYVALHYIDDITDNKNHCFDDLHLDTATSIELKIGIKEDAKHMGGINIFGKEFGNYHQDILMILSEN